MGRRLNAENAFLQWLQQHDGVAFYHARFQLSEWRRQGGVDRGGDLANRLHGDALVGLQKMRAMQEKEKAQPQSRKVMKTIETTKAMDSRKPMKAMKATKAMKA